MTGPRDAYKVLQVDAEADLEVIQAAYRRLAQKYHPDRADAGVGADAALRMVEINAAWAVLRDPAQRRLYDGERALPAAWVPGGSTSSHAAGTPATPPPAGTHSGVGSSGSAGPPPGRPSGSVLNFGRYSGWSLGEIGRVDPAYLEWLDRTPIGRPYRAELDVLLRRLGARPGEQAEAQARRGLFRRR